jgi:hypothetical protein
MTRGLLFCLLLGGCASLAPQPTDDEFYYLSKEQSSIVWEGPCQVSLNGIGAVAYCFTHESQSERDPDDNPVVYVSVHNIVTRERVVVFEVRSGVLHPVWMKGGLPSKGKGGATTSTIAILAVTEEETSHRI